MVSSQEKVHYVLAVAAGGIAGSVLFWWAALSISHKIGLQTGN